MRQNDIDHIDNGLSPSFFFLFYLNHTSYTHAHMHTRIYIQNVLYILYIHFVIKCKYRKECCYVCNFR